MSDFMEHVLTDLKVLDLTRALAGPSCTRMLAEMGAEVIKVEAAPNGDITRQVSRFKNDRSLYYIQQNLNKKSLCVNMRDPRGMAIVKGLVPKVDIVVENYRPGIISSMGLGYEALKAIKDDIILCSISALGQTGPLSSKPGYDYVAQAYSGVTSMIGEKDDAPYIPLVALGDVSTGIHAALAILAALHYRDRSGKGQALDIALLDVYYGYHEVNVHQYTGSKGQIKPFRNGRHLTYICPAGVFRATGGSIVIMGQFHHWERLCTAMERTDLLEDKTLETDTDRLKRKDEIVRLIESWLATLPDVESAIERLEEFGVPCAPILTVEETVEHPHLRERGTIRTVSDPLAGNVEIPGMPLRFSEFPEQPDYQAALLGEHNREIVTEWLGHSEDEFENLRKDGVLIERMC